MTFSCVISFLRCDCVIDRYFVVFTDFFAGIRCDLSSYGAVTKIITVATAAHWARAKDRWLISSDFGQAEIDRNTIAHSEAPFFIFAGMVFCRLSIVFAGRRFVLDKLFSKAPELSGEVFAITMEAFFDVFIVYILILGSMRVCLFV
ncbi:hypothetical protein AOA59_02205 [Pseudomonas sp. 2822-15]|nr:hypothetical protein AOA59_02205 [Pseudomonas sp. 2822-15]